MDAKEPPGSVADVVGPAAGCPEVRWRGQPYKVGWPTPAAVGRLELLVAAAAVAEAKDLAASGVDPGAPDALRDRLLAREHRVGGKVWEAVMGDPVTRAVLVLLALLREHHPGLAEADVWGMAAECQVEVQAAVALVAPDFLAAVEAARGLPKGATAALTRKTPPPA
jgi:hypothetical protein